MNAKRKCMYVNEKWAQDMVTDVRLLLEFIVAHLTLYRVFDAIRKKIFFLSQTVLYYIRFPPFLFTEMIRMLTDEEYEFCNVTCRLSAVDFLDETSSVYLEENLTWIYREASRQA